MFREPSAISNLTEAGYPPVSIHALIERQAVSQGNREAVRFKNTALSYEKLNEKANRFAHVLIADGIRKGDKIGLLADRSEMLPVLLLAILKTGAAYIPLDPEYPENRISYMLENAGAALLITLEKYSGTFSRYVKELTVESIDQKSASLPSTDLTVAVDKHDLAYILYTSGSTGKPKGVMVEHGSVVNLLWHLHTIGIVTKQDRLLAITTVSFDIAVLEIFLPLIAGAQLVITDSATSRDGASLLNLVQQQHISVMQATPVTWKIMLAAGWEVKLPLTILCCGEPLPMDLAQKLVPRCEKLYNYYGPTETTIYSTGTQVFAHDTVITIGKPVANTQVYILDDNGKELGTEEEGELYIGGDGVAQGYINQPELTGERFINTPKGKLFRTGDLGKWTEDGNIYLFGRADQQIKIRGFRIEPGEIESLLLAEPTIEDAVVIAREDTPGNKMLVAYIVPAAGQEDIPHWKRRLQQNLPDYMVPHEYVVMDRFPLTLNWKIDKKALPRPAKKISDHPDTQQHVLTETEMLVSRIWQEALEQDFIGVDDDFFDIGGHSLIAVEIMCKLEAATGKKLPIAALFEAPTIRLLGRFIESGDTTELWHALVPVKATGNKPPLYIVHGDGLNVMIFNSMARNLDEDQPVFGLQPRGMNGVDEPDESIEEIASYYISGILKNNPHGLYLLAGYSFGGIVAFEMAKQLQSSGRVVKMLAMFDTNVGNIDYTGSTFDKLWKKLRLQLPKMLFILDSFRKYPRDVIAYQRHILKRKWKSVMSGLGLSEKPDTERLSEHEKRIFEKHQQAFHRYHLSAYEGGIDLFRVKQRLYFVEDPNYLGWKNLAKKGVAIHKVPGDHRTFLLPPNDAVFAECLQNLINKHLASDQ